MSQKIYLINIGANLSHARKARSPIFPDGRFEFVSFPGGNPKKGAYPKRLHPYVKKPESTGTHLDPDWENLTYGDCCDNPRAGALARVTVGDIFLFWGLLWKVNPSDQDVWKCRNSDSERGWYLFGAYRISSILKSGELIVNLPTQKDQRRAVKNAHVHNGKVDSRKGTHVFLGDPKRSVQFECAVDLGIRKPDSLLQQVFLSAEGKKLQWKGAPQWHSSTRTCRAVLDCERESNRARAEILRKAILKANSGFDLLA